MIPAPSERDIQKQCLQYLALRQFFVFRVNSGAIRATSANGKERMFRMNGAPGCADLIGLTPAGRFFACEIKKPGNRPTEKQQAFLDRVQASGGLACCVHSVDELAKALAAEGVT